MENETFDAIVNDNGNDLVEQYVYSVQAEGDLILFLVYPAANIIYTDYFHFIQFPYYK